MLHTIINHADYYSRTIERVPHPHYISILSRLPTSLSRVVEVPLIIEIRIIGFKSRGESLLN